MDVISDLLNNANDLPTREMLKRMDQRIASGEDESTLIIKALRALEHLEGRQLLDALELGTRNRRELKRYFEAAINQAAGERDALRIEDLQELQELILNPPDTSKTIEQETIDLALGYWAAKRVTPTLTYKKYARQKAMSTGMAYDAESIVFEAERIRTAVSRVKKANRQR
jgi:hypothetical protein